jgi:glycosyltransferase involved in cell wall biosynthesis
MPNYRRVLFLTLRTFSSTGGIEKVCKIFAKSLSDIKREDPGFDFKVFSLYDKNSDIDNKYLDSKYFIGFAENKWRFFYQLYRESTKADLIVLSHVNILPAFYLLKCLNRKPVFYLFAHGIELWDDLTATKKNMLLYCQKFLSVSQYTAKLIEMKQGIGINRINIFPNCLDPFLSRRQSEKSEKLMARYSLKKDDIVLLTLTRLSSKEYYKGYDHVLNCLNRIVKYYPNCKYLIVGNYDLQEKMRIDGIIEEQGLQNRVVITGYIDDQELEAHYRLADLYVMPSKKEGFGIVFIEAMFYGLPVIAGNKDGSPQALLGGELGILIDPDSEDELVESILNVLEKPASFKPDQQLLQANFGYDKYVKRVKALLAE